MEREWNFETPDFDQYDEEKQNMIKAQAKVIIEILGEGLV